MTPLQNSILYNTLCLRPGSRRTSYVPCDLRHKSIMASSLRRAQIPIRARGSNRCPQHQGKEVVFVCVDCDGELACTTCSITTHKKHELEEFSDVIPQIKVTMEDFVNKTESTHIPDLNGALKNLDGELSRNKEHFKDVITKIQTQNNKLKQALDTITNQLIQVCRDIEEQNNDILKKQKSELQLKIEKLGAQLRELKDALQTGSDTQVYDISREIPNDVTVPALTSLADVDFNATSVKIDQLSTHMGQLCTSVDRHRMPVKTSNVPLSQQYTTSGTDDADEKTTPTATLQDKTVKSLKKEPNIETFKSFKSIIIAGFISTIQAASPNNVLINAGDNMLKVLSHTGEITKKIEMEVDIKQFCVSPSTDEIWFCNSMDKSVRKVTGDKSTVMFHTNSEPLSMCISADENILMGMERQIVKYTQRGQILCQSTQVKQVPVVRFPDRISLCPVTKNVVVVDRDLKDSGGDGKRHVAVLNEDLQLLCRYYGHDIKRFCPCDVCYNDTGDIYIADYLNKSVQQISGKGEFIQTVYTDSDEPPEILCVQSNGDIWAVFGGVTVIILQKQH